MRSHPAPHAPHPLARRLHALANLRCWALAGVCALAGGGGVLVRLPDYDFR